MRRAGWLSGLGMVAMAALGAAVYWQWIPTGKQAVAVETVQVTRGNVETTLALTGTVVNDYTVQLTALLDGEITAILAREGDSVDAGAVLATLDDEPPRALLDKAEAELALRKYELDLATRRYDRMARMSEAGDESAQVLEDSLLERQRAEAALQLADADHTLAELRLENASVRAPFAGSVTTQAVETGQWVEAGTRLFTLVAQAGRVIEAEADAGDFPRLAAGQSVTLSLAESPELTWTSKIVRIAESVSTGDGATGNTFTVRIDIGEDAPRLLLGQQLDVDVSTAHRDNVLRVPLAAVRETGDGQVEVWVDEQGRARRRVISLGLRTIDQAEVIDGLDGDEQLVLPAGAGLEDDMAIDTARQP